MEFNSEKEINLSYVVTTFNKIAYLKVVLEKLILSREKDEEIIVFDGASSDGTQDYLEQLYKAGKIQYYVSERDLGEAHGYNKGILIARGEIIKIITDDDCFNYSAIKQAKTYMIKHQVIDVVGFNGISIDLNHNTPFFSKIDYSKEYENWKQEKTPFFYCGLGFMFRKKAISVIGLLNTNFKMVDYDFALRITSSKINLVWSITPGFVTIVNPASNSFTFSYKRIFNERKRAEFYYKNTKSYSSFTLLKMYFSKLLIAVKGKRKQTVVHDYKQYYQKAEDELTLFKGFDIQL